MLMLVGLMVTRSALSVVITDHSLGGRGKTSFRLMVPPRHRDLSPSEARLGGTIPKSTRSPQSILGHTDRSIFISNPTLKDHPLTTTEPRNPYRPGLGEVPPVLAGREPIIDRFYLDLEQVGEGGTARETALYGLRGMGKTALLGELVRAARQAEWLAVRVETESEVGSLVSTIAGGVARPRVLPVGWDRGSFLNRFGEFAAGAGINVVGLGGVDARIRVKTKEAETRPSEVLVDLYQELGRIAADQGRGVALLIDETQRARVEDLRGLFRAISEAKTEQLPVITAFAGLLETPDLLMSAATSAERVHFEEIGVLDPAATYRALRTPADRAGVVFDQDGLDMLIEFSEGYPYFIQQLGSDSWNVRSDPERIGPDDAERAIALSRRQFERGALGRRWVELPEWGRHVVAAISVLVDRPAQWVEMGKVAELVGKTSTELSMTRRRLRDRGAVDTERGQIRITQPGFHWYAAGLVERGELELRIVSV